MFDRAPMLGQVHLTLGQHGGGGAGGGGGGGGPAGGGGGMVGGGGGGFVSVGHGFSGLGPSFDFFNGFGYPSYYPNYYPPYPQQQNLVCKKDEKASEREGTDVFNCTPQAPAYNYPVYSPYTYPIRYVRPFGWY